MEETFGIRKRSDIPVADTWATEDLFATDELWEEMLQTLEEDKNVLASYAGKLSGSAQALYEYLSKMEAVDVKADRLGNY